MNLPAEPEMVVHVNMPVTYNPGQTLPSQGSEHHGEPNQSGQPDSNAATAPGKICELCGAIIGAGQEARRRVNGEWIHEACPIP
jgi:hypothetical protein